VEGYFLNDELFYQKEISDKDIYNRIYSIINAADKSDKQIYNEINEIISKKV